ncbi:uncharacterized protein SCHCODRAFT_02094287, partial [Schizophyllum commune H4-8]|uniref:uncharacterized protein n=1 Tax=Schizophyllum commune (strain H4-8 / FGSC 9210) TaxID=578458 RepID=UPI00215F5E19
GFRPAPPTFGNFRPRCPRRAFCVLRPSPSPPSVLTTVFSSPGSFIAIPSEGNGHHDEIPQNLLTDTPAASQRDLRVRHLSPIPLTPAMGSDVCQNDLRDIGERLPCVDGRGTHRLLSFQKVEAVCTEPDLDILDERSFGGNIWPARNEGGNSGEPKYVYAPLTRCIWRSAGRREGEFEYVASFLVYSLGAV